MTALLGQNDAPPHARRARYDTIAPKPANLTFEEAAVVPVSACTALQGLRDKANIPLRPGKVGITVIA